jgi:DNA-binding NtrC family response regulator
MEDIPSLLDWFLRKTAHMEDGKTKAFSSDALKLLCNYPFPGNVRELRNIVQNSYYSCPGSLMQIEHLPLELRESIADPAPDGRESTGRSLYDRIRGGTGNFDSLVKEPFQKRNFGRNVVRNVLRRALIEAEGRYREAFRLLRVPAARYSSMMIFLKRHGCYLDFRDFRQAGNGDA